MLVVSVVSKSTTLYIDRCFVMAATKSVLVAFFDNLQDNKNNYFMIEKIFSGLSCFLNWEILV